MVYGDPEAPEWERVAPQERQTQGTTTGHQITPMNSMLRLSKGVMKLNGPAARSVLNSRAVWSIGLA